MGEYVRLQRVRNTKRNLLYGSLKIAATTLLPFVTRTLVIWRFGVEYVGLNSVLAAVIQFLNLSEMGLGFAVAYSMYRPVAEGDSETVCALLRWFRRTYRLIGLWILCLGGALTPLLPLLIRDTQLPGALDLYLCYGIYLGDCVLGYLFFGHVKAIPTALQRNDIVNRLDVLTVALKCAAQALLLLKTRNYYAFLLVSPVLTVLRGLLLERAVRRAYPQYVCRGELDGEQKRAVRKKLFGLFVGRLLPDNRYELDALCVSAFFGLTLTGIYNNYLLLVRGIDAVSRMLCWSMTAGVGNSLLTEPREKNLRDMRRFDFLYSWLAGWASICLLCLLQPFMRLWVGEGRMLGMAETVLISLCVYTAKSGDIRELYSEAAGLWWECRFLAFGEVLCNLLLSVLLGRLYGVRGVVFATLFSLGVFNFALRPFVLFRCCFAKDGLRTYFLDHAKYALSALLCALACFSLCAQIPGAGVGALALRFLVCLAVPNLLYAALWARSGVCREAIAWLSGNLLRRD